MMGRNAISPGIEGRLFRLALGAFLLSLVAVKTIHWHSKRLEPRPADLGPAGGISEFNI
jgi:hypothetical protein